MQIYRMRIDKKLRPISREKSLVVVDQPVEPPRPASLPRRVVLRDKLLKAVVAKHGSTVDSVLSKTRGGIKDILARQELMYLLSVHLKMSTSQIGRFLGRDHTTVVHGIEAHRKRVALVLKATADDFDPETEPRNVLVKAVIRLRQENALLRSIFGKADAEDGGE